MGYEIEFYKTENGSNPIFEFINSLQANQTAKVCLSLGQAVQAIFSECFTLF